MIWYFVLHQQQYLRESKRTRIFLEKAENRIKEGRRKGKAINEYEVLLLNAGKLYDISSNFNDRLKQCQIEFGVKMTSKEWEYLEDQRTVRKMECDKVVDPVWYAAMMKKQHERQLSFKYRQEMERTFRFVDIDDIGNILNDDGTYSIDEKSVKDEEVDNINSDFGGSIDNVSCITTSRSTKVRCRSGEDDGADNINDDVGGVIDDVRCISSTSRSTKVSHRLFSM